MRKLLFLGFAICIGAGCASPKARPSEVEWNPHSRADMELLIGQTVMSAMKQYHRALLKREQEAIRRQKERAGPRVWYIEKEY